MPFEYRQAQEVRDALARESVRYLFLGKSGAILGPALKPLASSYTLHKLLATVPAGAEAPEELVELLDLLAG